MSNPVSVTSLEAVVISVNEIILTWVNGSEYGVQIERTIPLSSSQSGGPTNYVTLALLAGGVSTYVDTTVQAGSAYFFRVTSLPFSPAAHVPAHGVTISVTTPGAQNHRDASSPVPLGTGNEVSYALPVSLDGTSTTSRSTSPVFDPPIVDPGVNGIVYNP
jgi:hypothetical protein